jgi:hypothetical protein
MWMYAGKNMLPAIVYFLFPILVVYNNKKMKDSLKKDLKEVIGAWWISSTVSPTNTY